MEEYYGQYLADGSGDYKLHRNENVLELLNRARNKAKLSISLRSKIIDK